MSESEAKRIRILERKVDALCRLVVTMAQQTCQLTTAMPSMENLNVPDFVPTDVGFAIRRMMKELRR